MNDTILIAVDPGKSGGIAIRSTLGHIRVFPMPDTESGVAELMEDAVCGKELEGWSVRVVIERVGGFVRRNGENGEDGEGGQPGSRMFVFGRGVGVIVGWCLGRKIPFIELPPSRWTGALGLGTSKSHAGKTAWKRHLLDQARKRHPHVSGITLRTCDALHILDWVTQDFHHTKQDPHEGTTAT